MGELYMCILSIFQQSKYENKETIFSFKSFLVTHSASAVSWKIFPLDLIQVIFESSNSIQKVCENKKSAIKYF